jgi:uncharacterized membrane protein YsdA (DUF1294 family)
MIASHLLQLATLLLGYNLFVFATYFIDKRAARLGHPRVSERTLLMLALFAGSPGAITAQRLLRHKTQKEPFRTLLMGIAALHVVLLGGAAAFLAAERLGLV